MHGSSQHKNNQDVAHLMREQFPAIRQGAEIYFDSAATTQMPAAVTKAVADFYDTHSANPGRGAYDWAAQMEQTVAETRQKIAKLLNAANSDGIIFTSGTTMSLNMVATCWGAHTLQEGDEILLCHEDHHSMTLPWKRLAEERGLVLTYYRLHPNGSIDLKDLKSKITAQTRLCCVTHVNNTAGWVNDLQALRAALPENILLNLDAAQSISHIPVDVTGLNIDFVSFSGHKMFAQTGIGVLYCSPRVAHQMQPLLYGGSMAEASDNDPVYKRLEAGTLNLAGIISLNAALDFLQSVPQSYIDNLTKHLYNRLLENPRIDLVYEQKTYDLDRLYAIASFTIEGWDSGELGDILAEHNIFVRAGRHCAGVPESVRISLQAYNSIEEIDHVCDLLNELSESYI